MVIYRITNMLNGRQYIGRTVEKAITRWRRHKREAVRNCHPNIAIHGAIRRYGAAVFHCETLARLFTKADLLAAEMVFIEAHNRAGIRLYNLTAGGDGSLGLRPSIQTRLKQREKALKRNSRVTSVCCKPCIIDGVAYLSITDAARQLNVSRKGAERWAHSGIGRKRARRSDCQGFKESYQSKLVGT